MPKLVCCGPNRANKLSILVHYIAKCTHLPTIVFHTVFHINYLPFVDIVFVFLQVYFGYVEYGLVTLKKETTPHSLKVFLEEEWAFSKEICPFITGGMAEAGKRFW